ncbi:MAG: EAL domain-containing protein [Sphaerochaetaceae bacterium]|nr:EAL domain-containing protein [Sphaerochaetaceae bacterium]
MARKNNVLIIEDNELNRELLSSILEDTYNVIQAENGLQGLDILKQKGNQISLILLDIQMPVMNGYEFLEAIKAEGTYSDIPIIVTTAGDTDQEQIKCLSMGASDFVIKPYNPEIVKKRAESFIRLRETFQMLHKVEKDSLTGAYSRESFCAYASNKLATELDTDFDMVCVEIESFNLLQSRYGAEDCDTLLRLMVKNLMQKVTPDVIVGRIGESQLALLMHHRDIESHKASMQTKFNLEGLVNIPNVKLNCGVYANVDKNTSIVEIIGNALLPIDKIRNQYGQNIAEFDDSVRQSLLRKQFLESSAKEALKTGQFYVYYQPKFDVKNNTTGGAEALIRWIHPQLGFMNPGEFIPIFESNGFVYEIDLFVFKTVCSDLRRWIDQGSKVVPVSVNVSQMDFDRPNIAQELADIADSFNIPHNLLHLEITESANASDKAKKFDTVFSFNEKGFKIELDDFGTGYSTLSALGELPIDTMKIDMSLIRNMFEPKHQAILKSVIYTAEGLKLSAVAEGVETQEQVKALMDMCQDNVKLYVQGYFYSKPLPVQQFEHYLLEH